MTHSENTSALGMFERYLSVWVALSLATGVALGLALPALFETAAALQYANVNFIIAVLIWVMVYPMMIGVDFASLKDVGRKPKGLCITLVVNWLIKPFTMALLGLLFFEVLFVDWVDAQSAKEYIAGMILLGVAPCTAMVFVWSQLVRGDANYTLVQVTVNDLIMVFAFAPLAALLLGVAELTVPWNTLLLSVLLYVAIPLIAGYLTRQRLARSLAPNAEAADVSARVAEFTSKLKPYSVIGLLATVVLLFGFQAQTIIAKPQIIALIALPLIIQSYGIFALAYGWAYLWRVPFSTAAPAALIGTSNFFELAVAVAISLFGLNSGAALATVVGVLVEVPVMLSLVALANRSRTVFDARSAV